MTFNSLVFEILLNKCPHFHDFSILLFETVFSICINELDLDPPSWSAQQQQNKKYDYSKLKNWILNKSLKNDLCYKTYSSITASGKVYGYGLLWKYHCKLIIFIGECTKSKISVNKRHHKISWKIWKWKRGKRMEMGKWWSWNGWQRCRYE